MGENISITARTLAEAVELLNVQYDHIRKEKKGITQNRQEAYYNGMRAMLEFLASNGYTDSGVCVQRDAWGDHAIFRRVSE